MFQYEPFCKPEQRLIAAIMISAYRDMLTVIDANSEYSADAIQQSDVDRAVRFLTDHTGSNARLRNHYCSLLDIDGDLLAERMRRMLDGELAMPHFAFEASSNPAARNRSLARHSQRVAAARARWFHLKKPTSTLNARSVRTQAPVTL